MLLLTRWSLGHFTYSGHLTSNETKSGSVKYVVSAEQMFCTQLNRIQINTRRMEMVPSVRKHVWTNLRIYVNTYVCVCVLVRACARVCVYVLL